MHRDLPLGGLAPNSLKVTSQDNYGIYPVFGKSVVDSCFTKFIGKLIPTCVPARGRPYLPRTCCWTGDQNNLRLTKQNVYLKCVFEISVLFMEEIWPERDQVQQKKNCWQRQAMSLSRKGSAMRRYSISAPEPRQ